MTGSARIIASYLLSTVPKARPLLVGANLVGILDTMVVTALPLLTAAIVNALVSRDGGLLQTLSVAFVLVALTHVALHAAIRVFAARLEQEVAFELRRRVFVGTRGLDARLQEEYSTGDVISRTINDVAAVQGYLSQALLQAVLDYITVLLAAAALLYLQPALAVLIMLSSVGSVWWVRRNTSRLEQLSTAVRRQLTEVSGLIQGWSSKRRAAAIHQLNGVPVRDVSGSLGELKDNSITLAFAGVQVGAVNMVLTSIPNLAIFALGAWLVIQGRLAVGALVAFSSMAAYFYAPLQRLILLPAQTATVWPAFTRVRDAIASAARSTADAQEHCTGVIARKAVIPIGKRQLLVPEFSVGAGECVGVVGRNGAGKSSLLMMLAGCVQPTAGSCAFRDGETAGQGPPRARVLPQDIATFPGTLLDNITLFDSTRETEARAAAARLGLTSWIESLPDGWNTRLDPSWSNRLSTGQLQRLGLARVLAGRGELVLLDEPGTAIDAESRADIRDALHELHAHAATVIVSHDPYWLANCDRTYEINALDADTNTLVARESPTLSPRDFPVTENPHHLTRSMRHDANHEAYDSTVTEIGAAPRSV